MTRDLGLRPRLLLCGFTAFPAAPRNPAGEIVDAIAREGWRPSGAELETQLLPVTWDGAFSPIEARLAKGGVDGVLIVGVAAMAQACRIERLARNIACIETPDAAGARRLAASIRDDGADCLSATAPVEAMVRSLEHAGVPCRPSDDAGDYLCNFTLYHLLEARPDIPAGFLHIPQAAEFSGAGAAPLAVLERGVKAATQAFATSLGRQGVGEGRGGAERQFEHRPDADERKADA